MASEKDTALQLCEQCCEAVKNCPNCESEAKQCETLRSKLKAVAGPETEASFDWKGFALQALQVLLSILGKAKTA